MKSYAWLTASIPEGQESRIEKVLKGIDNKKWLSWKKDLYATYYLKQLEVFMNNHQMGKFHLTLANISTWNKDDQFVQFEKETVNNAKGKFQASGVIIIMMATLVTFFIYEVFANKYLFNFSIDAIVAVIAGVILFVNVKNKYKMIGKWTASRDFIWMDALSVIMVILLRTVLPKLDFSLIVFVISYFVQKKKFDVFIYK